MLRGEEPEKAADLGYRATVPGPLLRVLGAGHGRDPPPAPIFPETDSDEDGEPEMPASQREPEAAAASRARGRALCIRIALSMRNMRRLYAIGLDARFPPDPPEEEMDPQAAEGLGQSASRRDSCRGRGMR